MESFFASMVTFFSFSFSLLALFVILFSNRLFTSAGESNMKILLVIILLLPAFFTHSERCSAGTDSVGIIKTVSGEVLLVSAQSTLPAAPNMKISQGDAVKTGAAGSAGLIFDDDTVVSLGPNSEFTVESFRFNPVDYEFSFVFRLIKGTFCFVTGQIAKLAPNKVKFATPEATLGVRGTKFLVKID